MIRSSVVRAFLLFVLFSVMMQRPAAAQGFSEFESILVPISVSRVPGGFGSLWSTELWFRNNSNEPVAVFPLAISDDVPTIGRTTRLPIGVSPAANPGRIVFMRRNAPEGVQFDLRLFNESDPNASWGTKLPVVRERQFADEIHLINVPTAAAFRTMLRIYGLPDSVADGETVRVRIYSNNEVLLADAILPLTGTPRYAAIASLTDSFPQIRQVERIRVHVQAQSVSSQIWAFVSVVSNQTQHVSLVTPD